MKIIENLEQGSAEWHEARRCMITGTKLDSVMGTPYDKLMLVCELIAEEATEQTKTFKSTPEMERGSAEEVFARKHFEQMTGKKVVQLGFCISEEFPFLGISGDGWIKKVEKDLKYTSALEIKSPDSKNAVFYKLSSVLSASFLGLGYWSAITKANPDPVFKPSVKAPFLGVPAQYKWQSVNYFLVNPDLEELNFAIYDARFIEDPAKMTVIKILRSDPLLQEALEEAKKELVSFREFWVKCREVIIVENF